ncbi:MAG: hypothetical protein K0S70_4850 [Microbacterium sp.]|jgi:hypothetical protein|nr:hypothetical protein [Microbacterium sp.]
MRHTTGSTGWTADALRARLRTADALETSLPASSRLFAERRLEMLDIAADVDAGRITPTVAVEAYEAIRAALVPHLKSTARIVLD